MLELLLMKHIHMRHIYSKISWNRQSLQGTYLKLITYNGEGGCEVVRMMDR